MNFNNFLLIGYTAWTGFSKLGPGVVFCEMNKVDLSHAPFSFVQGNFLWVDEIVRTRFLNSKNIEAYLHEWIVQPEIINNILQAVNSYNPQTDIILLIRSGVEFEIDILKQVVITPPECYKKVCQRWDEFLPYVLIIDYD